MRFGTPSGLRCLLAAGCFCLCCCCGSGTHSDGGSGGGASSAAPVAAVSRSRLDQSVSSGLSAAVVCALPPVTPLLSQGLASRSAARNRRNAPTVAGRVGPHIGRWPPATACGSGMRRHCGRASFWQPAHSSERCHSSTACACRHIHNHGSIRFKEQVAEKNAGESVSVTHATFAVQGNAARHSEAASFRSKSPIPCRLTRCHVEKKQNQPRSSCRERTHASFVTPNEAATTGARPLKSFEDDIESPPWHYGLLWPCEGAETAVGSLPRFVRQRFASGPPRSVLGRHSACGV